jgi:hypothetical protein
MQTSLRNRVGLTAVAVGAALGILYLSPAPSHACTVFVLTDTNSTLFFNNEDWSSPKTRIWFIPASGRDYGYVCVGFEDNVCQGGLNSEGLAYDVVAGYQEEWQPDPKLPHPPGHSPQRMLETCATVQEAIAFYRSRQEPGFAHGKLLVADKTGTSAIIGFHEGKLRCEIVNEPRGFGFGAKTLETMLAQNPKPTIANGAAILRACRQKGRYATKYSNGFDLKSGQIVLFPFPDRDDQIRFALASELKKGGHYYDMPQIREQLNEPLRLLLPDMKRGSDPNF